MPDVFRLIHPNPHTRGGEPFDVDVPIVSGQQLRYYFRERRLIGLSLSCRIILDRTNDKLRLRYEPKPNDVIKLVRVASMS